MLCLAEKRSDSYCMTRDLGRWSGAEAPTHNSSYDGYGWKVPIHTFNGYKNKTLVLAQVLQEPDVKLGLK